MSNEVAVLFTYKSIETITRDGGTSAWRLDRNHARRCAYAVCTRNAHAEGAEGNEDHQSGFMVGKISDVALVPGREGRFIVLFSEYALIEVPNVWKGDRNPVKYAGSLEELGIDEAKLHWRPMPAQRPADEPALPPARPAPAAEIGSVRPLSMLDAKAGLALTFGVKPEAIEITIRG